MTARAFLLAPDVLGPVAPTPAESHDKLSVAYLLMLAARMQQEAGRAWSKAQRQGKRVPVLTLDSEIAFESPAQRAAFAAALQSAVTRVVAEHTSTVTQSGDVTRRRYRLALGCYPL